MPDFWVSLFAFWLLTAAASLVPCGCVRMILRTLMPAGFAIALIFLAPDLVPWQRLVLSTVAMLYMLKGVILLRHSLNDLAKFSLLGLAIYWTVWPGVNPEPFRCRIGTDEDGARFARGLIFVFGGAALAVALALSEPYLGSESVGWGGILSLLFMIHFGYAEILTCALRLSGWNVPSLFEQPLQSESLREFWSKRWNLAFVEMNKILFASPVTRKLGVRGGLLAIFAISGLLHEAAISYPVLSGWGGPLLYFVLQGACCLVEGKYVPVAGMTGTVRRLWVLAALVVPLPLLFTTQFRAELVIPLFQYLHRLLTAHDLRWWFGLALWCATAGNIIALAAGAQVPWRLNWRVELWRLSPFNRKIFLNYYAYIGLAIMAWAVLSALLHKELLDGDRAAVCLAAVIACFWGLRVLVDLFFFQNKDWPNGAMMLIGHACLTALFCLLTATYLGLVIWHWPVLMTPNTAQALSF